jgi:hypothetical protein
VASVKGTSVLQLVKALRLSGKAARATLAAHLHHYLEERILVSSWYPIDDYLALLRAVMAILPRPPGSDPWELCGELAARHDLNTVYKGMVRGGSLARALKAARDLWTLYWNVGRIELGGDEAEASIDLYEFPVVSQDHCRFMSAFLREQLRLALGREVRVDETMCRSRGDELCRRVVS